MGEHTSRDASSPFQEAVAGPPEQVERPSLPAPEDVVLDVLLENTPGLVTVFDEQSTVVRASASTGAFMGVSAGRLLGHRISDYVSDDHRRGLEQALAGKTSRTEGPFHKEPIEGERFVSVTWAPVADDRGAITGGLVLAEDTTAERRAKELAERVAEVSAAAGQSVESRAVEDVDDLAGYDAFVIGGAVYMFHWLKPMSRFLRRNREVLAERRVWLFSSGPLGTETTDAKGRDVLEVSGAKEATEIEAAIHPRGHRMFFGAYSTGKPVGLAERFVARIPAARDAMPEGDFRDWDAIEAWAGDIARELEGSAPSDAPRP
jgi:menaquinone-dependent protoporphyrinogen oxidase